MVVFSSARHGTGRASQSPTCGRDFTPPLWGSARYRLFYACYWLLLLQAPLIPVERSGPLCHHLATAYCTYPETIVKDLTRRGIREMVGNGNVLNVLARA